MFCPKCGTQNPDANKFCRSCRESLLVVAQAMKKRLPVMIVSKLDAALERLSERFRRDCFLWSLFGVGGLIGLGIEFSSPVIPVSHAGDLVLSVLMAVIGFSSGLWSYLAFKRSLTLGERFESGDFSSGSVTIPLQPEAKLQILFCPTCGANAQESLKHCRSCGADLKLIRSAVKPGRLRAWLNYWLDRDIESASNKSEIRKASIGGKRILAALAIVVIGFVQIYVGKFPVHSILGSVLLVMGVWDYYASRRWFSEEEKMNEEPVKMATAPQLVPTTNELALPTTFPMSITEETTRRLEPVLVQSQEEAETRKL